MLTDKIKGTFAPLENETLDEYLIRSLKNQDDKNRLLEVVISELKNEHQEEIMSQLNHMFDVLGNPKKRFGIHPDDNGREALWELVFSRPANYGKPTFLLSGDVKKKNQNKDSE